MFAACVLAAVSQSYALVSASRVLMALGAALVGPMVSAAAANLVAPEIRGKALGTAFAGLTLATVFGVPVTTFFGEEIGWRWAMALVGCVALVSAVWVLAVLPSSGGGKRRRGGGSSSSGGGRGRKGGKRRHGYGGYGYGGGSSS